MTTTINTSYFNNPTQVGKGGTGVSSNTAYGLLAAGTSSTGAFQQLGAGTSNQILVSGGSSALGTQTNNDSVGCWQLISTQNGASSASVSFTGLSTSFENYKVIIYNAVPVTNNVHLQMYVSSNNGSSYHTASTDYYFSHYTAYDGSGSTINNNNTSLIPLDYQGLTNSALANFFEITFVEPDTSNAYPGIYWIGKYDDNSHGTVSIVGQGRYNGTAAINAIQFLQGSGNISTGTFNLYALLT